MMRISILPLLLVTMVPAAFAHDEVLAPNGGEVFQFGEVVTVDWTVTIEHALVGWDVEYSLTGDQGPWLPIAMGLPPGDPTAGSQHRFDWLVPDTATTHGRVRVRMLGVGAFWDDVSDADFSIEPSLGIRGCTGQAPNSSGSAARVDALGSAVAGDNNFTLALSGLPSNALGYVLNSPQGAFVATPGTSQGNLCLGGGIGRHGGQVTNSGPLGLVQVPIDLTTLPRPMGTATVLAGETWVFQYWTRDANPTPTSNFSDSVSVTFL